VGGDERRPLRAGSAQSLFQPGAHADEGAQPERDAVAGCFGLCDLVGQLEAGQDEQVVEPPRPLALGVDLTEVRVEVGRLDVVVQHRVIGDREHVEAVASVEVAELAHAERPVAPGRVCMQLAEERVLLCRHMHRVLHARPIPTPGRHLHTAL
jgi:hypothetical protein